MTPAYSSSSCCGAQAQEAYTSEVMARWWFLVLLVGCREPPRLAPSGPSHPSSVEVPRSPDDELPADDEPSANDEPTPQEPPSVPVSGYIGPEPPAVVEPASAATCARLEMRAKRSIEALRQPCARPEDCALFEPRCPFGCYAAVATAADRTAADEAVADFAAACPVKCGYKCARPPTHLECVDGTCSVPDLQSLASSPTLP